MSVVIPTIWIYMVGACMVAILGIQLADAAKVPKWAQWVIAAACIVLAWVMTPGGK